MAGLQANEKEEELGRGTTRKYSETLKADIRRSKEFRRALLDEAMACMMEGDVQTGKSSLRTYINATIGFVELGAAVGVSPKSLMRMFSDSGNPQARNLFEVVANLQKINGAVLKVVVKPAA